MSNTIHSAPLYLFQEAVEQAQVAILISDLQDNILYSNSAVKSPTIFFYTIKQSLKDKWELLRANKGKFTDQEIHFKPGGYQHPRWFICSGKWYPETDQQSYLLLIAKEITTLKRQQEEMHTNALRALLAEEELTEGMRETLAGAIHQLQLPINLISAALNLLKRRAKNKDSLCTALQQTLDSVNHAVEHMRQSVPISDHSVAPVNLNELIRDILMISTQRLLAQGITVEWQPALVLPSILGYIKRLRSLFKQLIDNSIESMNDNQGPRELRIISTSDLEQINVIIEDTGKGIPNHLHFKIFEPFFTTKKTGKGAGMGLAAVQEIVNLHAGCIRIDPNYTQGSRFIIQFPTTHQKI
ncbi:MAG: nitrogen fixation negative regulator NifL [Pseudomonadota bacterium]